MIAVSPLTYVRDTANALMSMIHADALPHRIYNLSSGYTTSAREQLLTLYRTARCRATSEPRSGNASGATVSVERIQCGHADPGHRVAFPIHVRRSA
jgi:nucleoside-diphosphate-sugar epimerase